MQEELVFPSPNSEHMSFEVTTSGAEAHLPLKRNRHG